MTRTDARMIAQRSADKYNETYLVTRICAGNYTVCRDVDLNGLKIYDTITPEGEILENETIKKSDTDSKPCGC